MNKRRLLITMCLTIVLAVLTCGVYQGRAQPPDVQPQAALQLMPQGAQKTTYQRRQEAKKHLQEAIEARKSQKTTGVVTTGKATSDSKEVRNE